PTPVGDPPPVEDSDPLGSGAVHATLDEVLPDDGIVVLESPTSTMALRNRLRISQPGSYYFCAGGGLGYGLSAGIGVQLAQPNRPVACVLGEGSVQYAVSGFWTAVAYQVPVTFLILRNNEYGILKWFAEVEQVSGAPGLDLPALETAEIARGYGVDVKRVRSRDELREALSSGLSSTGPSLVEVDVAPGMSLF
ncbi:MAG: thiamine pyrophosphate tpp-binding protein, partial [Solirubrobacteraceae bacterium]|nr:thiamine pyrophosphate tpp-binding protein [Solirubrobacteraceae bacterium]